MKKTLSPLKSLLLPLILLSMLLSACGGKPAGSGDSFGAAPQELAQAILDSGAFSEELELLDNEIAYTLFGFDSWSESYSLIQDSVIYYSSGATSELCAVIVVGKEYYGGDMSAATGDLEDWLADQIEAEKNYRPSEVTKLEHAILDARDNTILLVVADDAGKAQAAVDALN